MSGREKKRSSSGGLTAAAVPRPRAPQLPGFGSRPPPPGERATIPAGRAHAIHDEPTLPYDHDLHDPRPAQTYSRVKVDDTGNVPVPSPSRDRDRYVGRTIDNRYRIDSVLGEGGMGVVYRCTHTIIDKTYAIKILRSDFANNLEAAERFLNEAKGASAIGNVHIVDIIDFGELPEGQTYLVMEHLDGQPLTKFVGVAAMPLNRVLHIARQIAVGLAAAHEEGIIHRDLKPDNVFVLERGDDPQFVKIVDFGIAKMARAQNNITRAGTIFGTPHYMSPEQAKGTPVDERTDVYSLGVIMYEMAAGRLPFDAEQPMGILSQHLHTAPMSVREAAKNNAEISVELESVIHRCLEKEPPDRYASMRDLIADLDRLAKGQTPEATALVPPAASLPPTGGPANEARDNGTTGATAEPTKPSFAPSSAQPTSVAAAAPEPQRSRWPWVVGALSLAVGIAGALVVVPMLDPPERLIANRGWTTPINLAVGHTIQSFSQRAAETAVPEQPGQFSVAIVVSPIDAEVYQGEKNLGRMPVAVNVEKGTRTRIKVARSGFITQTVIVDGSTDPLIVELRVAKPGEESEEDIDHGAEPMAPPDPLEPDTGTDTGTSTTPPVPTSSAGPAKKPVAPPKEPPKPAKPAEPPPKDPDAVPDEAAPKDPAPTPEPAPPPAEAPEG